MSGFEGIIMVTGMGNAADNGTDAWTKLLFPAGVIVQSDNKKWVQDGDRRVYLFEVYYDDLNQMLLTKFEGLKNLIASTPAPVSSFLESHISDVFQNVVIKDLINASQVRFVEQYKNILSLIDELEMAYSSSRVGVLSHGLGTYIAYEGLYKVCDLKEILKYVDLGLVMAAPMLSSICSFQTKKARESYLTQNRSMKPYNMASGKWKSSISTCVAIYNTKDPFYKIHDDDFYDRNRVNNDLVNNLITYEDGAGRLSLAAHSMEDSYLPNNIELVRKALLGR